MIAGDTRVKVNLNDGKNLSGRLRWSYSGKPDEAIEIERLRGQVVVIPPQSINYVEVESRT